MAADAECMIREQIVEGVKISPQECLRQRINDQIVDIPVSSIAQVLGVPCATPVEPQIGDLGFDKDGELCEVICIDGRSSHVRGQVRVLYTLGTTRTIRDGPMDTSQRLHCRARCQAQEALTVDSVRDGYRRPWAGYKYRAQVQVLWLGRDQFDACAYDLAEIKSMLENFENAFKLKVPAEYIIHMCTKPMSCCLLHDQVSRDSWLHPRRGQGGCSDSVWI